MITAKTWNRPTKDDIARLIASVGCSKAELGKEIGYTQRAVEKWASGENEMSFCVWFTIRAYAQENAKNVLGESEP